MGVKYAIAISVLAVNVALLAKEYRGVVIVLPERPTFSEGFAAKELQYHLEKATDKIVPVLPESKADEGGNRFYVGNVNALTNAGCRYVDFLAEERLVKGVNGDVYLVGGELPDFDRRVSTFGYKSSYGLAGGGTLYAVYDFLENEMGVRWIWPGELGEVIPRKAIPLMDGVERRGREPLLKRMLRGDLEGSRRISIANRLWGWKHPVNARRAMEAKRLWLTRNRTGSRRDFMFGHAFIDWHKRFKERPEVFAMQPTGLRGRFAGTDAEDDINKYYPLCVANPKVHDIIVAGWTQSNKERFAPNVQPPYINCCENDSAAFCICSKCRSWDAADPLFDKSPYWSGAIKDVTTKDRFAMCKIVWEGEGELARGHNPPSVTDRYVRFYNAVLEKARAVHPLAEVCAYAYVNYREPPKEVRVSDGVVISYVPAISFPYAKESSEVFRKAWAGWNKMGATQMFYRPNYMHNGGNMPYSSAKRMADDMNFAYAHGMIAIDQDSLNGAWSAQAMKNYVAARVLREPDATYGKMSAEFYSAFGAAAEQVREYCEMLEALNDRFSKDEWAEIGKRNRTVHGGVGGSGPTFALTAADLYSEEWFAAADALLVSASAKVAGQEKARVEFLRKGLKDGLYTYRTRVAQKTGDAAVFKAAFKDLVEYRASIEADNVLELAHFCDMEASYSGWPHAQQRYYLQK